MMEFELKTNSWHFWLSNFGTRRVREWRDDNDLCSYTQAVLQGLFWFALAAGAGLTAVGLTGNMLYEVYNYFTNDVTLGLWGEIAATVYVAIIGILLMLLMLWFLFEKAVPAIHTGFKKVMYGTHEKRNRPPGFIALAYRKFKEKTCFKIKFKTSE